jgi:hypothetical protein
MPHRPTLTPSGIGQFFRLQSCPMYLQWQFDARAREHRKTQGWQTSDLSPVLQAEGMRFEHEQLRSLDAEGCRFLTGDTLPESLDDLSFEDLSALLDGKMISDEEGFDSVLDAAESGDLVIHQPKLEGRIGCVHHRRKARCLGYHSYGGEGTHRHLRGQIDGCREGPSSVPGGDLPSPGRTGARPARTRYHRGRGDPREPL